jgi:hypothetical protein
MGVIANIRNFFEGDIFLWWFPKERTTYNDGKKKKKKIIMNIYRLVLFLI